MAIKTMELTNWELKGFYPHVPHLGQSMETSSELMGVTDWIPATVPGSVHYDLWAAGWIEDPYFGMNSLKCEWVENRWWMYRTKFRFEHQADERVFLHFAGIDYKAHFYLNHKKLGEHEGMFVPVRLDITDWLARDENELIVLFEHVPDEMGQIGYTSRTRTQKSRFTYKWDFSTRMVPIGLWDKVFVETAGAATIEEVRLQPTIEGEDGTLQISGRLAVAQANRKVSVHAEVADGAEVICQQSVALENDGGFHMDLVVRDVKRWHPSGAGEPNLYSVTLTARIADLISDVWHGNAGFRTLQWIQNEGAPESALPYTLQVNGKRVYIKGVNLTPLDIHYGTVTKERYAHLITMLKQANVNLVRVWGGGIIEKREFYDACDRAGILVWQEFIQSSSGIDNVPSKHPEFLKLLEQTARSALLAKRNHACLACWSGGNELMDEQGKPATYDDDNIAMLRELVEELDPGRFFFPTSASGPNEFLQIDQPGQNHDVHGPWKYGGPVAHYELFNRSDSLLHSEFGVDGCSSVQSIKRFLPPSEWAVHTVKQNPVWRHHGEWWDTLERDIEMFGSPNNLDQYVQISQWVQAEGIRYALEANRRRQFNNSGSIVWQFNECFPNVSSTSLVDYYYVPKMAYYWMRKAYATRHLSLRYEKLIYEEGEVFAAQVFLHDDGDGSEPVNWSAELLLPDGTSLWKEEGVARLPENSCKQVASIDWIVEQSKAGWFMVKLELEQSASNVYVFSSRNAPIFSSLLTLRPPSLEWHYLGKSSVGEMELHTFQVMNSGTDPAMYVAPHDSEANHKEKPLRWLACQAYEVLLQGQQKRFDILTEPGCDPHRFTFQGWNSAAWE